VFDIYAHNKTKHKRNGKKTRMRSALIDVGVVRFALTCTAGKVPLSGLDEAQVEDILKILAVLVLGHPVPRPLAEAIGKATGISWRGHVGD
jgi:hypothetical protein